MSDCDQSCDGCAAKAEHHLCDACCNDELDALRKERDEARAALAIARREGAEAMREAAAQYVEDADDGVSLQMLADDGIRALPLPEEESKP